MLLYCSLNVSLVHLEIALYFSDRNNDCAIVLCPLTLYGHNNVFYGPR